MQKKLIIAISAACALLAGCGSATTAGLLRGPDDGSGAAQSEIRREAQGGNWRGMPGGHELGIPQSILKKARAKLDLTDEQIEKLRDIAKSHAATLKRADFAQYHSQLKGLLLADKIDEAALRAFILARVDEFASRAKAHVDLAAQLRDVLTADQRKQLVALLSGDAPAAGAKHHMKRLRKHAEAGMDAFKSKLALTPEQATAFDALSAKLEEGRKAERPELKKAAIAFIEAGDKAALAQALGGAVTRRVPTDDLVRVASLLDKAQRQKIVDRMDRFDARMRHRHGRKH